MLYDCVSSVVGAFRANAAPQDASWSQAIREDCENR